MTDQQIDEFLEMLAKSPTSARDMVRGLFAAPSQPAVPAEIDVRTILLGIVPGDGNGHEVYAKTVDDVVNKLTELSERLEAVETGLTDEEIKELALPFGCFEYGDAQGHKRVDFARAIIAALREKEGK